MATIPSPQTWAVGEQANATKFNSNIRDSYNFFLNPPMCAVRKTGDLNISSGTAFTVPWDIEDFDNDGMHSNVTNNTRFTAVTAGWYLVSCHLVWEAANFTTTGQRETCLIKNGNTSLRQSRNDQFPVTDMNNQNEAFPYVDTTILGYISLGVGDYVEVEVFQDSGQSMTIQGSAITGAPSRCFVKWVRSN